MIPASEETDVSPDEIQEIEDRQSILPLLIMGLLLVGVGFYAVLRPGAAAQDQEKARWEWSHIQGQLPRDLSVATDTAPQLAYALPHAQRRTYRLRQVSERVVSGEASVDALPVETLMRFDVVFEPGDADLTEELGDEVTTATLRFAKPRVALRRLEREAVGRDVAAQLEHLLGGAEAAMGVTPHGRVKAFTWRSALNPQVRPTLELIEDAITLLLPRFPTMAVNPGEQWEYEVPFVGAPLGAKASLEGGMIVEATYTGEAVLDEVPVAVGTHRLTVESSGVVTPFEEDGEDAISYTIEGSGDGAFAFNHDIGVLHSYEVALEVTTTVVVGDGEPVVQRVRYELATEEATGVRRAE